MTATHTSTTPAETRPIVSFALFALLGLMLSGCENVHVTTPDVFKANSGSTLTTAPGQDLAEDMFLGKWDIHGDLTNSANGLNGVQAIPSDIAEDLFGRGWRFERGGIMRISAGLGTHQGEWKVSGDTVSIRTDRQLSMIDYTAQFSDGYLWLTRRDGRVFVFEKDKFFGL
jgi:hypothetical protein